MLDDTRTRRISNSNVEALEPERQFLVGNDEDEDLADEVRSFRSSASMDEEDASDRGHGPLMSNNTARTSHLDVGHFGDSNRDEYEDSEHFPRKGNGLAAKAGTIMVSP